MKDALYFLPMIAHALQQPDPAAALRDALARIRTMGHEPRYRLGYEQFLRFLDMARRPEVGEADVPIAQIAEAARRPMGVDILVERDGEIISICAFGATPATRTIGGVVAGAYLLRLDTGRVLWEGRLAKEDLLWARAFPKQPLRVAADTGESRRQMTREIALLDGTVILRVFAGVESGTMEIELKVLEVPK
jgi:hypothetical protein